MVTLASAWAGSFARNSALQAGSAGRWEPGAHPIVYTVAEVGPWVLGVVVLALVVRALVRAKRYRALTMLGPDQQEKVHAALIAAEKQTVGEIVPVVVERSDAHPAASWLAGLCAMLVGAALLQAYLPWHAPHWLLLSQVGLGALGYAGTALLPDLKRTFVPRSRADEVAQEQAFQEFHRLGLHRTEARTGVLLFVSLLEHRVIVLGDEGIDAKVDEQQWDRTKEAILAGVRRGDLAGGLVEGIRSCGEALARHFPWAEGDRNEVPDRLVVRRE